MWNARKLHAGDSISQKNGLCVPIEECLDRITATLTTSESDFKESAALETRTSESNSDSQSNTVSAPAPDEFKDSCITKVALIRESLEKWNKIQMCDPTDTPKEIVAELQTQTQVQAQKQVEFYTQEQVVVIEGVINKNFTDLDDILSNEIAGYGDIAHLKTTFTKGALHCETYLAGLLDPSIRRHLAKDSNFVEVLEATEVGYYNLHILFVFMSRLTPICCGDRVLDILLEYRTVPARRAKISSLCCHLAILS